MSAETPKRKITAKLYERKEQSMLRSLE